MYFISLMKREAEEGPAIGGYLVTKIWLLEGRGGGGGGNQQV
jgi:hypothetical protein